jgi:hypothetical protein
MSTRAVHVSYFADGVRAGRHERTTAFLWTDPATGETHDVSEEVLAEAGTETATERESREVQRERDWPLHLAGALEEDLYRELEWGSKYVRGHKVQAAEADDDHPDELIYIRDDGKRYLVEIHVDVRPE